MLKKFLTHSTTWLQSCTFTEQAILIVVAAHVCACSCMKALTGLSNLPNVKHDYQKRKIHKVQHYSHLAQKVLKDLCLLVSYDWLGLDCTMLCLDLQGQWYLLQITIYIAAHGLHCACMACNVPTTKHAASMKNSI